MKILVTDRHGKGTEHIEIDAAGAGIDLEFFDVPEEVTDAAWASADAIVTYRGTEGVINAVNQIQRATIVVRGGVGFDGLDLKVLGERGIAVSTVPDYGTTEVADHALSLLLALRRGVTLYDGVMQRAASTEWTYLQNPCIDRLRGRVFGIVGLGRIGLAAARRAVGFDMDVAFYDPFLPDGVDLATGFKRVASMDELAEISDAISVHSPLTAQSHQIINAAVLARMKTSAVVINTSRGPTVDVDALYTALRDNSIAGAGIDVWPVEPPESDHPLLQAYSAKAPWLDGRFILSPHAAFYSPPGLFDLRTKAIATAAIRLRTGEARNCQNLSYLTA